MGDFRDVGGIDMYAKILVVDDKRVNRVILERHLQKVGYHNIVHASNGQEALDLISKQLPDLILLDIVMPGIDGFEVCKLVKQDERTKMIPIVMVTALDDQDSKLKCINIGADDILNKPVDPAELTARVRSLIQVKRYFDQLKDLNHQLVENIKNAERIQRALLPKKFPEVPGLHFESFYQPTEYVGGDCYNVFQLNSEQVCLYIADVTGHQFDAALLTVFIKEIISGYARQMDMVEEVFSPAQCLEILDQAFKKEDFPVEIFITIYLAVYDISKHTLTYSSAGFAQGPIVYGGDEMRTLYCSGKMIMGLDAPGSFDEQVAVLKPGEGVLFYTDGIIEQPDKDGKQDFGIERLQKTLQEIPNDQKRASIAKIIEQLKNFAGMEKFEDDVAMINLYIEK